VVLLEAARRTYLVAQRKFLTQEPISNRKRERPESDCHFLKNRKTAGYAHFDAKMMANIILRKFGLPEVFKTTQSCDCRSSVDKYCHD
jgi:hypothetical protein